MREIAVAELFGPICVDLEDGEKLYATIRESFDRRELVTLDFTGVTTLTASFLAPAVGRLYATFAKEFVEGHLHWRGLDRIDEAMLGVVQRKALFFYAASEQMREVLLAAEARRFEE